MRFLREGDMKGKAGVGLSSNPEREEGTTRTMVLGLAHRLPSLAKLTCSAS